MSAPAVQGAPFIPRWLEVLRDDAAGPGADTPRYNRAHVLALAVAEMIRVGSGGIAGSPEMRELRVLADATQSGV